MKPIDQTKCYKCKKEFRNGTRIFNGGASLAAPQFDTYVCIDCYEKDTGSRWVGFEVKSERDISAESIDDGNVNFE